MPVDLKRLKHISNPCPGFLLTRDQVEEMQVLVGAAIAEIEGYRNALSSWDEPLEELIHPPKPITEENATQFIAVLAEDIERAARNLTRMNGRIFQLRSQIAHKDGAIESYEEFYGRLAVAAGLPADALPCPEVDEIILKRMVEGKVKA